MFYLICNFVGDDYYDSGDVTDFSDSDDDKEITVGVDVEGLDKWIPPLFYLAKSDYRHYK